MSGANFMDGLDCGSFFAHIDDLIEFLADNEIGLNMIDFPSLWTDNSDTLPWSDQYYPAATAIAPPTYLLNLLFRFLKSSKGGFVGDSIKWNFSNFLADMEWKVVDRNVPTTSPLSIEKDIKKLLGV